MTNQGESSYHPDLLDEQVLEKIVRTYAQPLTRYAYTLLGSMADAEDAMEDAIAALLVRGGSFRSAEHMRAWLYRTTRNKAMDHLRRRKREVPLEDVQELLSEDDALPTVLSSQQRRTLYECMQKLPQQYREVLELHYFARFSVEQICHLRHKSSKQVYNLLARARASLKEYLIKEDIGYEGL